MNMSLGPGQLSLKNFGSISSLEVELSKTWPQHGPNMVQVIQHSVGLTLDFSQILKHFKQVEAMIHKKKAKN